MYVPSFVAVEALEAYSSGDLYQDDEDVSMIALFDHEEVHIDRFRVRSYLGVG